MATQSSQNKHIVGMLKIAVWAVFMFFLIQALDFAGDKFSAFVSALDIRGLLMLIGILMILIGVLTAALCAKKVSSASFGLSAVLAILALTPIGFGAVLVMKQI